MLINNAPFSHPINYRLSFLYSCSRVRCKNTRFDHKGKLVKGSAYESFGEISQLLWIILCRLAHDVSLLVRLPHPICVWAAQLTAQWGQCLWMLGSSPDMTK
jgi:hypothetical protein